MSQQDFLVELGAEELPPKALKALFKAFSNGIRNGLEKASLTFDELQPFATPRRLAVIVSGLQSQQPDQVSERRGPSVSAAFDDAGEPTRAASGFAQSCKVSVDQLDRLKTDKGEWLVFNSRTEGKQTDTLLPGIVEKALNDLPIPKRMRWGSTRHEFVRPVHWLIMLFGEQVIPCTLFGIESGNQTWGHRFHANHAISIAKPAVYVDTLEQQGRVIADFEKRQQQITTGIEEQAKRFDATVVVDANLLDEVTAMVEWPVALSGNFSEEYLELPEQVLVCSMITHQKFFHMVGADGKMLPKFITVANIQSNDPEVVISGNERVIRPRLADAAFFYQTDQKTTLRAQRERLKGIVFQNQLGSVYEKTVRIAKLSAFIAGQLQHNDAAVTQAGELCKSDLVTDMVSEFPELQGLMGYFYASKEGLDPAIAEALNEQYLPGFSGGPLPQSIDGSVLSVADKIDTLVGIFGIKKPPSGTRDPFALRRSSLGVLRILVDNKLDINLRECLQYAANLYPALPAGDDVVEQVFQYMTERFKVWYQDQGVPVEVFNAVCALGIDQPIDIDRRIDAVNRFRAIDGAADLSAANKRVANILAKQASVTDTALNTALLEQGAETTLADSIAAKRQEVAPFVEQSNYFEALNALVALRGPVDQFFDDVMVMCDDADVRNNRMILLTELRSLFLQVADISLLPNK
ncbi:MAG: glycine--tRNA ligase subunit beta [Pseudomonadales bacterium]|nr:glycine--tRNA ligase subunit beta [Pseudomonadales bacterium]